VKSYGDGVRRFIEWCDATGTEPVLNRPNVTGFIAAVLDAGAQPATARTRHLAVRRFAAWLLEEDELDTDPLIGLKPPKLDTKVVDPFSEAELKALLAACSGRELRDRRDEALLRFMLETGARAGEVVALGVADVDLAQGVAIVRRGKGGKGRSVPFGPQTGRAIDRYIRTRRAHRLASTPELWLGDRGKGFTYDALHQTLGERARTAGVQNFRPHRLRHTAAHRWLAAGGSEGGLMAVAGWTRPDMLLRYTKAQASARAADEARKLNLGDV
jgi:site-specific recombinase XerD